MNVRVLTLEEAGSAQLIQGAIDALGESGGRLVLPAMELTLDRGLCLRSGVELVGQGKATVLRKGPGRVYPLSGYHNYGMCDVPLRSTAGLGVGMTVSIHDSRTHGGFYETFATITSIDGNWVGLDHGIEADYRAEDEPCLTTVYPLVFAHRVRDVALRDMRLEGNRAEDEKTMGGCRGGAVYFYQSCGVEVTGVAERDYRGEGLSFQMCRDVHIHNSRFDENAGNGLHPGAGSTNALFEGCAGTANDKSGFFFCVRANHITVKQCQFSRNGLGISIGTRDCHNLIEECTVEENGGQGILARQTPSPTEVHSCEVRSCRLRGNAHREGRGQIEVIGEAHDLAFVGNELRGGSRATAGIFAEAAARNLYLADNDIAGCDPHVDVSPGSLIEERPDVECGYGVAPDSAYRHLPQL
ncbi:right-handed parallel beta-helix repeat-containing protein [Candidatus Latescibacterota bacterium]